MALKLLNLSEWPLTEETKGSWLNRTAPALLSPPIWRLPWGLNSVPWSQSLLGFVRRSVKTSCVSDQKNLSLDAAPLGFHKSSQRPTVCVGRAPAETDREGIASQLSIWSGTVVRRGASRPVSLSAPDGWANTRLTGLNNSSKGLASPVGFRCNATSPSCCVRQQPTWSWVKILFASCEEDLNNFAVTQSVVGSSTWYQNPILSFGTIECISLLQCAMWNPHVWRRKWKI